MFDCCVGAPWACSTEDFFRCKLTKNVKNMQAIFSSENFIPASIFMVTLAEKCLNFSLNFIWIFNFREILE